MRSEADISKAIQAYADTIRRICFMHLNNRSDVEDVFQEVFLKYALMTRNLKARPMNGRG